LSLIISLSSVVTTAILFIAKGKQEEQNLKQSLEDQEKRHKQEMEEQKKLIEFKIQKEMEIQISKDETNRGRENAEKAGMKVSQRVEGQVVITNISGAINESANIGENVSHKLEKEHSALRRSPI